eukprot:TRINITY_DN12533_c0_g1_i1.p1 TRINITY_DN12533_c0_g1~~TRINITY_DN12533_c0_g1_i1.p1  ORF type:complete len:794 (+),score=267.95 TRINITY_DN12533_c0_g1_i1:64-2445(+)
MSGLPREILKWLQSLDLSYSVKNPKRDFSNGFLIAEIVSRYWKGIPMHSFDNGTGVVKKRDNWEQLVRIFQSKNLIVPADLVDGVILCRDGSAVQLISQIYSFVTSRRIQFVPPIEADEVKVPPFQKATASKMLRDQAVAPHVENVVGDLDLKKKEERAQRLLREHAEQQQKEKSDDPARFKSRPKVQTMQAMRPPDQTAESTGGAQVNFKEVKVKTIDSATALRSVRAQIDRSEASGSEAGDIGLSGSSSVEDNVVVLMNRTVLECFRDLGVQAHFGERESKNYVRFFTTHIDELDEDTRMRVWRTLSSRSEVLGNAIFSRPGELAKLAASLAFLWDKHLNASSPMPESPDCDEALTLLAVVGDEVTRRDSQTAWSAFKTHMLPLCRKPLVNGPAAQRWAVLRLLSHWFRSYERQELIGAVRTLQQFLSPVTPLPALLDAGPAAKVQGHRSADASAFLLCLAALVSQEAKPLPDMEAIVLYYGTMGLTAPQPLGRAAALHALRQLLEHGSNDAVHRVFREVLPLALRLAETSCQPGCAEHWEVHAALLTFGGSVLDVAVAVATGSRPPVDALDEAAEQAYRILEVVLSERLALPARQLGITVAGRHALPQRPALGAAVVGVLLRLPATLRAHHLFTSPDAPSVPVPSRVCVSYSQYACCRDWSCAGVAQAVSVMLGKSFGEGERPFSTLDMLELLAAAVESNDAVMQADTDVQAWWSVLLNTADDLRAGVVAQDEAQAPVRLLCIRVARKLFIDMSGQKFRDGEPEAERDDRAVRWLQQLDLSSVAAATGPQ